MYPGKGLLLQIAKKAFLDKFVCGSSSGIGTLCGSCVDGCSPRASILTK